MIVFLPTGGGGGDIGRPKASRVVVVLTAYLAWGAVQWLTYDPTWYASRSTPWFWALPALLWFVAALFLVVGALVSAFMWVFVPDGRR